MISARFEHMSEETAPPIAHPGTFVLGVDLDGVCADYTEGFRVHVAEALGKDPRELPDPRTWELTQAGWGIKDTEHYYMLHQQAVHNHLFATMREIPGASDVLWRLSDAGVHIRVITHRLLLNGDHALVVSDTVKWLQAPRSDGRSRIPYRDLAFLSDKTGVGADLYIDDAPHNIAALRKAHRDVICFAQPYNTDVGGLRAANWDDVERIVMERYTARALNV
jgi:5'(3')-deoxyribonucleotidase